MVSTGAARLPPPPAFGTLGTLDATHRRLLTLLSLAVVFEGYGRSLIVVALPYVGEDLGVSAAALSYAMAFVNAGSLGVLVLGPLADRFGRRTLLLAAIACFAVLGTATATARSLFALIAWQAAARIFQEGALFSAAVITAEEMPAGSRGTAQGLLGGVNSIGSGLGALLLATIAFVPGGWRGLCVVTAVPLLLLPLLARSLPESRRWLAEAPSERTRRLPRAYRGRLVAALALMFLAMGYDVAGFTFATYLPITAFGWSPGAVSALVVVAGGIGLPGWWLGGRMADHFGRRTTAIVFLIGLTLAQIAFYQGGSRALWPAFAAMVFCQGGKITVARAWATELFPTRIRGAATGWLTAGATLGSISGLAAAGAITQAVGGIANAVSLIAMGGLAAAAVTFLLPETRGMELEAIAPEA